MNEILKFIFAIYGPIIIIGFVIIALLLISIIFLNKKYKKTKYHEITGKSYFEMLFDKGASGEYFLYDTLKTFETENQKFLFNLYVPADNGKTSEIDVVLISKVGIIVFESKNYSGWIFGNEKSQYWTQTLPSGKRSKKTKFFNPLIQNQSHISKLKKYLGEDIPYFSMVVFTDNSEFKNVNVNTSQAIIAQHHDLIPKVFAVIENNPPVLTDEQIASIYDRLYTLTQVGEDIRQKHIQSVADIESPKAGICPICNSKLVLRTARKGANVGKQFYGCSSYPRCKYTADL